MPVAARLARAWQPQAGTSPAATDSVAAVIPAFNEGPTVGAVVKAVKTAGFFVSVIVVSDGSTDDTVAAARAADTDTVLELPVNGGKGAALAAGLNGAGAAGVPLVCFLDADLVGLTPEHLARLAEPVLAGRWAMSVGMWDRGPVQNFLAQFMPLISGQRVLRREVFEDIPPSFRSGYKCETAMNWFCRSNRLPYGRVFLPGLRVRLKPGKVGWLRALTGYVRMYSEVLSAMIQVRLAGRRAFVPGR